MDLRDAQLAALENVILSRDLTQQIRPEGKPTKSGFISSYFGERQDPFTGHEAFHRGVDFAGAAGSEVVSVAAGVVTWAGARSGYGSLIEINHGNGYVTRYGHNQRVLVTVGQTVTRGQAVALMGSTGRSTGPHVHFEVLKNGRQINPASFLGTSGDQLDREGGLGQRRVRRRDGIRPSEALNRRAAERRSRRSRAGFSAARRLRASASARRPRRALAGISHTGQLDNPRAVNPYRAFPSIAYNTRPPESWLVA